MSLDILSSAYLADGGIGLDGLGNVGREGIEWITCPFCLADCCEKLQRRGDVGRIDATRSLYTPAGVGDGV